MGVSTNPAQLEAKLSRLSTGILSANKETVAAAADVVKLRVLAKAAPATGGDLKLSGTKNKSVGVRTKVTAERADVKATGPMHWLEDGVKPHAVAPKKAGGSRASRSAFIANAFGTGRESLSFGRGRIPMLQFADGSYRPYARKAGGLKAQHVWTEGVEESRLPVRQVFKTKQATALTKVFG